METFDHSKLDKVPVSFTKADAKIATDKLRQMYVCIETLKYVFLFKNCV